jgi:hypothetical protein
MRMFFIVLYIRVLASGFVVLRLMRECIDILGW